ncbi:hypothetical protein [Sphingobium sp. TKS]|uniref:hypothetical protein n=1 Tax=Sphingobium sp. TKS TaxID=1315974 RepID=UPI0007700755|nr:hypothetical protein [Sphingobium sp. TKS]AMK26245.1 hypothetical protein K426_26730 [Sphingobium sp. TKS]
MRLLILPLLAGLASCGSGGNDVAHSLGEGQRNETAALVPEEPVPARPEPETPVSGASMPEFAPQYPGSIIKSVSTAQSGSDLHEVSLETSDDAAAIMAFYREKFLAGGLRKTADFMSGGTGMLSAAARDKKASIAISKNGARNVIIVTFSGG